MATIQLSKIQFRRGPESDLPNTLDDGEPGFTIDTGRLFIGQRTYPPHRNIEVLTENSISDNQRGFFTSVLIETDSPLTLQTFDNQDPPVAHDFHIDLDGSNANAVIQYFVFDSGGNATRQGTLNVIWNASLGGPLCVDTPVAAVGAPTDLRWSAIVLGSVPDQHVVVQYINQTGNTQIVMFRLDRPIAPPPIILE